jgi:ArsR family transcriptional regulator
MLPHEQLEYRQEMGHVWLGFPESEMNSWLQDAGFERVRIHPLPADPAAKGPTLFVASATKRLEPLRARGGNGTADSVRET